MQYCPVSYAQKCTVVQPILRYSVIVVKQRWKLKKSKRNDDVLIIFKKMEDI